jgi:hypothetical protein
LTWSPPRLLGSYIAERSYGSAQPPHTIEESNVEARIDKGVLKAVAQIRHQASKAENKIETKTRLMRLE